MRLVYGQQGELYLVQMFEEEINSRNEKENLPKEFLFDGETGHVETSSSSEERIER